MTQPTRQVAVYAGMPAALDSFRIASEAIKAYAATGLFFEELDRTGYRDKFAVRDGAHWPSGAIAPTTASAMTER